MRAGTYRRLCLALALLALNGITLNAWATGSPQADGDAMFSNPGSAWGDSAHLSKTLGDDGLYHFQAQFRDFEGRMQAIGFAMPSAWSRQSAAEFGVSDQELEARYARCKQSPDCAWDREWRRYYHDKGMRLSRQDNGRMRMFVDVPGVVARNRERVQPVVQALRDLAARGGHDTRWMMETAIALVQGGVEYGQPKEVDNGRRILDFYPPPLALERGYGDCDTKSALLAAILQNLTDERIVGVHVPNHYLLGIAGNPDADQRSIEYEGESYILVEASGPAIRRPGDVSDQTLAALEQGQGMRIDPMY